MSERVRTEIKCINKSLRERLFFENTNVCSNVSESETYLQKQLPPVSKNLISDWLTPTQQLDLQRINSIDHKEEKHWFIEICQVQHIIHVDHKES